MSYLGDLGKSLLPSLLTFGTGMIANHQLEQKAKGEANDAKTIADLEYKTAYENAKAIALLKQGGGKESEKEKSNLPLYIGLGVGGVVVIGAVVFAFRRK